MLIALAIWTDQQEEPLRDELETKSFEEAIAPLLKEGYVVMDTRYPYFRLQKDDGQEVILTISS